MKPYLETDRLYMRPFKASDAASLFAMDSNPNVHTYLWQQPVQHIEECYKIISALEAQYERNHIGRFATFLKETDEFIGWTGIKYIDDHVENGNTNFFDYGYRLMESHWGKGYATEASQKWVAHGFQEMQIPEMHAYTHSQNRASNRVLQKIGMQFKETYPDESGILWNWYLLVNPHLKP